MVKKKKGFFKSIFEKPEKAKLPVKSTPKVNNKPEKKPQPVKVFNPINHNLTDKEELFVKYYPGLNFNGTKAAIKAGYSKKTARQIATNLLSKVYIQEAIQKEKRKIMDRAELTQDMVIKELRKIGFSDIKDYIRIGPDGIKIKDLKDIDTQALASAGMKSTQFGINMDFKLHNKVKALELLGQHFGTFNESNKFEIDLKNLKVVFSDIDFKEKKE